MQLELGLAVCSFLVGCVNSKVVSLALLDLVLNRLFMSREQNLPISLSVASVTLTLVSSLSSVDYSENRIVLCFVDSHKLSLDTKKLLTTGGKFHQQGSGI